jgi:hypothetical protein
LGSVELRGRSKGKGLMHAAEAKRRGDLKGFAAVEFRPATEVEQIIFKLHLCRCEGLLNGDVSSRRDRLWEGHDEACITSLSDEGQDRKIERAVDAGTL